MAERRGITMTDAIILGAQMWMALKSFQEEEEQ